MHYCVRTMLAFLSFLSFLSFLLICSLSSCSNALVYQFEPSGSEEKDVKNALQSLNLETTDDDVTVQVTQSLGDLNLIYITLTVSFDDSISFEDSTILPNVLLTSSKVNTDDVDSMDWHSIQYFYGSLSPGKIETVAVDATTNSISYLLSFGLAEWSSYNEELTLLVGDFMDTSNKKIVAEGIHVFHWVPEISPMSLASSINSKDDLLQGELRITPFAMYVQFSASPYESLDALRGDIKIILLDGTEFYSSSGAFPPPSGRDKIFVPFSEILDLNRVSSVKIGTITVVN